MTEQHDKTPRHDYREGGKFAKRPDPWAQHQTIHIDDNGHLRITDEPWLEPVERETWTDWRAVGLVMFVIAVLAAGAFFAFHR